MLCVGLVPDPGPGLPTPDHLPGEEGINTSMNTLTTYNIIMLYCLFIAHNVLQLVLIPQYLYNHSDQFIHCLYY